MNYIQNLSKIRSQKIIQVKNGEQSTGENVRKPKGRRTPYNYFMKDYQKHLKQKKSKMSFEKSSRLCAAKWKHLSQDAKKKYKQLADRDANRYKTEMARLTRKQKRKFKRKKRDPSAPVRPLTAYMWFCKLNWKVVAKANPGKTFMQVRKKLTKLWNTLTPMEKKKYEVMAQYDRKCYDEEKKIYEKLRAKKRRKN